MNNLCKCGNQRRKGGRYCLECHAKWMRDNRPKHKDLNDLARKKANCRAYTRMLVSRGTLKQKNCFCGAESEKHHVDYDNPRNFIPLCKEHHRELHI